MRLSKTLIVVPVLALLAMGCGPHRRGPGGPPCGGPGMGMMMHGCGPESCAYKSRCFSNGAVHSGDGVCQACNGGRWVEASGCADHQHGPCGHAGCGDHHGCQGGCRGKKCMKSGPGDHPCGHGGAKRGPHAER